MGSEHATKSSGGEFCCVVLEVKVYRFVMCLCVCVCVQCALVCCVPSLFAMCVKVLRVLCVAFGSAMRFEVLSFDGSLSVSSVLMCCVVRLSAECCTVLRCVTLPGFVLSVDVCGSAVLSRW